jgi:lipopolysaccharide transport system ATP-binding protein
LSEIVLKVENLGKKYIIGHQQRESYTALRDVLAQQARSFGKRLISPFKPGSSGYLKEEFWALKDVSFEVKQGDVVGIIGRNGAGKSTLLKILSRITPPTTGRITLGGRVASLLEVGTGFHPELTGRENIFLNGAILGMSRAEIKRKFDEIVDFAEIEKFLDTPVKRYSSGMYVRLAFAVAAHMEPEILVVDEVLAVGDAAFQKKCLGKMGDVASKEGRTVLFVSHNMAVIQSLCNMTIYLNQGEIYFIGKTEQTLNFYFSDLQNKAFSTKLKDRKDRQGSGRARVVQFQICDSFNTEQQTLRSGETYTFILEYELQEGTNYINNVVGSIALADSKNEAVFLVRSSFTNQNLNLITRQGQVKCTVTDFALAEGSYNCMLFLAQGETEILDFIDFASVVNVEGGDFFGTGSLGLPTHCKVLTRASWSVN